jgi:hypothetical protein
LSQTCSLFCSGCFGDGVLGTICPGWPLTMILPISVFQEARIIGVSHSAWLTSRLYKLTPSIISTKHLSCAGLALKTQSRKEHWHWTNNHVPLNDISVNNKSNIWWCSHMILMVA